MNRHGWSDKNWEKLKKHVWFSLEDFSLKKTWSQAAEAERTAGKHVHFWAELKFKEEPAEDTDPTGEFEGFIQKYKHNNFYDWNETTIRGSDFVIYKTALRIGKKKRRDVHSKSLRTQCEWVSDLIFKIRLLKFQ